VVSPLAAFDRRDFRSAMAAAFMTPRSRRFGPKAGVAIGVAYSCQKPTSAVEPHDRLDAS
jgi:hypothetical protein